MGLKRLIDNYDVTASSTFLQLTTCHADYANGHLVVTTLGHISDQDWATVLAAFPLPDNDYSFDCLILPDGIHVILLDFN